MHLHCKVADGYKPHGAEIVRVRNIASQVTFEETQNGPKIAHLAPVNFLPLPTK